MPRFDRTGPLGYGPGTGWGMGPCGYGRGMGRRFYSRKEEKEMLEEEVKDLEEELKAIKERLEEIKD
ncbi:MAG: hypothetical protein MCSN_0200 [Candidatus Microsyncoccus archaeolyticus]|nr:MAG: hypothetical protein MCSN_0200 [Candidatus Parcubacteria bacterium]